MSLIPDDDIECSLPVTLAMCAPAIRMTVVLAWSIEKDGVREEDHELFPVLAVIAKQTQGYLRRKSFTSKQTYCRSSPDHRQMESLGWSYQDTNDFIDFDYLIYDTNDFGTCEASFAFDSDNCSYKAFPCPWPPEEDEVRLAEQVAAVKATARGKSITIAARKARTN